MGASLCNADLPEEYALPLPSASSASGCTGRGSQMLAEATKSLLVAAVGSSVCLMDSSCGSCIEQLDGHTGPVTCVLVEQGMLFSGAVDRKVLRWDVHKRRMLYTMCGHKGVVWALSVSGGSLFSAGEDGRVIRWDLYNGTLQGMLQDHEASISCMVSRPGMLFTGAEDSTVRVWKLKSMQLSHTLNHGAGVTSLLFADGSLFSGCKDSVVRRWDVGTGDLLATMDGHENKGWILCLLAKRSELFSGCKDGTICQWDLKRNALIRIMGDPEDQHESGVTCFMLYGETLLSGSADGTVRLWNVETGAILSIFEGATGVTCFCRTSMGLVFSGQARGLPETLPGLQDEATARGEGGGGSSVSPLSSAGARHGKAMEQQGDAESGQEAEKVEEGFAKEHGSSLASPATKPPPKDSTQFF